MGLKKTDIIATLKASLLDAAALFGADDVQTAAFTRHVDEAVMDFSRARILINTDTLTLQSCVADYVAPGDAIRFLTCEMADRNAEREPYNPDSVSTVPTPTLVRVATVKTWRFRPAPTNVLLARFGSAYSYEYSATHQLTADGTGSTIDASEQPLLILRAQAAAMREAAIRNMSKPVSLRDGAYSQNKNGTPAALADQLMKMFDAMTRPDTEPYR